MAGHLGPDDPSLKARIAAFLDTELGEAVIAGLLSVALGFLPGAIGEAQKTALTRELRINALTNVGDTLADLVMGPLRQVLSGLVIPSPSVKPVAALPVESSNVKVSIPVNVPAAVPVLK
jgi:hypothetical protein